MLSYDEGGDTFECTTKYPPVRRWWTDLYQFSDTDRRLSEISPSPPPTVSGMIDTNTASGVQDPHLTFAHGGKADFRGVDNMCFNFLSAPGIHFALKTTDTTFKLNKRNKSQVVHGSFFTECGFVISDKDGPTSVVMNSSVFQAHVLKKSIHRMLNMWDQYRKRDLLVQMRHRTLIVRARGWEVNVTRMPIYNYVSGPVTNRLDVRVKLLRSPALTRKYGMTSKSCYPHGILGQSWDGDNIGISGNVDDYGKNASEITTEAQAEGAIEGTFRDYIVGEDCTNTLFKFSRFQRSPKDKCPPRHLSYGQRIQRKQMGYFAKAWG